MWTSLSTRGEEDVAGLGPKLKYVASAALAALRLFS